MKQLEISLGCTIPDGWPPGEYDEQAQRFLLDRLAESGPTAVGWYGWYAIERAGSNSTGLLIGAGGFLGPPDSSGTVEIGYSVVASKQGHGFATELVKELISFAFENTRVRRVIAHTTKGNIASCKLLEGLGFTEAHAYSHPSQLEFQLIRSSGPA